MHYRETLSASEMTYIVSSGALNSTHSLIVTRWYVFRGSFYGSLWHFNILYFCDFILIRGRL